jgi:hypothetical protein
MQYADDDEYTLSDDESAKSDTSDEGGVDELTIRPLARADAAPRSSSCEHGLRMVTRRARTGRNGGIPIVLRTACSPPWGSPAFSVWRTTEPLRTNGRVAEELRVMFAARATPVPNNLVNFRRWVQQLLTDYTPVYIPRVTQMGGLGAVRVGLRQSAPDGRVSILPHFINHMRSPKCRLSNEVKCLFVYSRCLLAFALNQKRFMVQKTSDRTDPPTVAVFFPSDFSVELAPVSRDTAVESSLVRQIRAFVSEVLRPMTRAEARADASDPEWDSDDDGSVGVAGSSHHSHDARPAAESANCVLAALDEQDRLHDTLCRSSAGGPASAPTRGTKQAYAIIAAGIELHYDILARIGVMPVALAGVDSVMPASSSDRTTRRPHFDYAADHVGGVSTLWTQVSGCRANIRVRFMPMFVTGLHMDVSLKFGVDDASIQAVATATMTDGMPCCSVDTVFQDTRVLKRVKADASVIVACDMGGASPRTSTSDVRDWAMCAIDNTGEPDFIPLQLGDVAGGAQATRTGSDRKRTARVSADAVGTAGSTGRAPRKQHKATGIDACVGTETTHPLRQIVCTYMYNRAMQLTDAQLQQVAVRYGVVPVRHAVATYMYENALNMSDESLTQTASKAGIPTGRDPTPACE